MKCLRRNKGVPCEIPRRTHGRSLSPSKRFAQILCAARRSLRAPMPFSPCKRLHRALVGSVALSVVVFLLAPPSLCAALPDAVYGQENFTTADIMGSPILRPRGMSEPQGLLSLDNGALLVSDTGPWRVLRYPSANGLPSALPDTEIGQVRAHSLATPVSALFQVTFATATFTPSQLITRPTALAVSANRLFVADAQHNRVLAYARNAVEGMLAEAIYGSLRPWVRTTSLTAPQGKMATFLARPRSSRPRPRSTRHLALRLTLLETYGLRTPEITAFCASRALQPRPRPGVVFRFEH